MQIKFKNLLCLTFAIFAISACSSFKSGKVNTGNFKGYYKVGEPYQIDGQWYYPKEQPDYDETGLASWYGPDFHGKKTANGDTFDANSLTAAHNTLPLPSMVRVTNLENNKTVVLMVNDRGPFSKGRVIDVSKRAAEILGFKDKGTAKVRVQFLRGYTQRLLSDIPKSPNNKSSTNVKEASYLEKEPVASSTKRDVQVSDNFVDTSANTPVDLSAKPAVSTSAAEPAETSKEKTVKDSKPAKKAAARKTAKTYVEKRETVPVTAAKAVVAAKKPLESVVKVESSSSAEEEKITYLDEKKVTKKTSEKKLEEYKAPFHESFIQAGTYSVKANAEHAQESLRALGDVSIVPVSRNGQTLYKVKVGPIGDEKIARVALEKVIKMGHHDAILVPSN